MMQRREVVNRCPRSVKETVLPVLILWVFMEKNDLQRFALKLLQCGKPSCSSTLFCEEKVLLCTLKQLWNLWNLRNLLKTWRNLAACPGLYSSRPKLSPHQLGIHQRWQGSYDQLEGLQWMGISWFKGHDTIHHVFTSLVSTNWCCCTSCTFWPSQLNPPQKRTKKNGWKQFSIKGKKKGEQRRHGENAKTTFTSRAPGLFPGFMNLVRCLRWRKRTQNGTPKRNRLRYEIWQNICIYIYISWNPWILRLW